MLNVALLMEPLEEVHKVTNLAIHMAWEAKQRGYNLHYTNINSLTYSGGKLHAATRTLTFGDTLEDFQTSEDEQRRCLNDMDVVLFMIEKMPFDMPFLTVTRLLEKIQADTLVVNDPRQIREAANKLILLDLEDVTPPTIITADEAAIENFREDHGEIIVKPLYGMHGEGVFHLAPDNKNLPTIMATLQHSYPGPWIIQKYIREISKGDKRLYLVDGEFIGGLNRIPREGSFIATTYTGGTTEKPVLTERDKEICTHVGAFMKERGLIFAGLDVIGDYLTEVNTGCPGGIGYINKYFNTNVQARGWDVIEQRLKARQTGQRRACA